MSVMPFVTEGRPHGGTVGAQMASLGSLELSVVLNLDDGRLTHSLTLSIDYVPDLTCCGDYLALSAAMHDNNTEFSS